MSDSLSFLGTVGCLWVDCAVLGIRGLVRGAGVYVFLCVFFPCLGSWWLGGLAAVRVFSFKLDNWLA